MKKNHKFLTSLAFLIGGCSSPTLLEKYRPLEAQDKSKFLSVYHLLDPEQKMIVITDLDRLKKYFKYWNIKMPPESDQPVRLRGIWLEPRGDKVIDSGTSIRLHARAAFSNHRTADATQDVVWKALPELGTMKKNTLYFDCVHSDIQVSANFLEEGEGFETYRIRKPLRSLYIRLADSSPAADTSEYLQVRLTATCEDGTTNDVSCQGEWDIDPKLGKFLNCGYLYLNPTGWKEKSGFIRATYGDLQVTQKIYFPKHLK